MKYLCLIILIFLPFSLSSQELTKQHVRLVKEGNVTEFLLSKEAAINCLACFEREVIYEQRIQSAIELLGFSNQVNTLLREYNTYQGILIQNLESQYKTQVEISENQEEALNACNLSVDILQAEVTLAGKDAKKNFLVGGGIGLGAGLILGLILCAL